METDLSECYRILDVESGASLEEVKRSYRELVKVWHPDRFTHEPKLQQKAQEKLKQINLAYEMICAAGPSPQAPAPSDSQESETTTHYEATAHDETTAQTPLVTKQRNNKTFVWAIAVVLVMALIAVKSYQDGKNAKFERLRIAAEQEQNARQEAQWAEIKRYEMQVKVEAEVAQSRKQAEADRLAAMEQARKQAEKQIRLQLSQQFDAERKTTFPGILIVTTQPSGASVTIDSDMPRNSPLSINTLMPGKHRVSIALQGYESLETIVEIDGAETTDMGLVQLQKATGSLEVSSIPSDVQFTLRLATSPLSAALIKTGRSPAKIDDLPPGDYVVTYQRSGWAERAVNIPVAKGKIAMSTLEYKGGSVVLTSSPAGAQVTRGGIAVGVTPLTLSGLPTQKVEYDFNMAGHEKVTLGASVVEGQSITLDAVMLSFDRIASAREIKNQPKPLTQGLPKIDPTIPVGSTAVVTFVVDRNGSTRDHGCPVKG